MAKKKIKPHSPSERWKKYKFSSGKVERGKTCPKCGPGMFLAVHKDRVTCGKCGYMEKTKQI
ncbi:MAG: 30S ribosomal protein S27ae [Candidatus Nanoarchaeia archaeon]